MGLHVFNPVTQHEARRADLPRRRERRDTPDAPARPLRGLREDVRQSRSPTPPASSSTACSSPYLFSAVRLLERDRHGPARQSTPACTSAPGTRWAHWRCSISLGLDASKGDRPDARRARPRAPRTAHRRGRAGRKSGRGFLKKATQELIYAAPGF